MYIFCGVISFDTISLGDMTFATTWCYLMNVARRVRTNNNTLFASTYNAHTFYEIFS